jgi:hypothetical protein
LGEEVGVDSDPDPAPKFISDAGVTGASADFGAIDTDAVAAPFVEVASATALPGLFLVAPFSAIGFSAGDGWAAEMGWWIES